MIAFVFPVKVLRNAVWGRPVRRGCANTSPSRTRWTPFSATRCAKLCLEDPDNRLKETQVHPAQPLCRHALHYYKAVATARRPSWLAGHSLGEYKRCSRRRVRFHDRNCGSCRSAVSSWPRPRTAAWAR